MPDQMGVTTMVGGFIATAILLSIGIQILGGAMQDCSTLPGYDANPESNSTSWAASCLDANEQTQNAYNLLIVVLVVIAAVAILIVIRFLG